MTMTFQQCKDRVVEAELGLTWDDWMLHHDMPKGRFVTHFEQMAADMYANSKLQEAMQVKDPTEEEIREEFRIVEIETIAIDMEPSDVFHTGFMHGINWLKSQIKIQ